MLTDFRAVDLNPVVSDVLVADLKSVVFQALRRCPLLSYEAHKTRVNVAADLSNNTQKLRIVGVENNFSLCFMIQQHPLPPRPYGPGLQASSMPVQTTPPPNLTIWQCIKKPL
jgi:hypothetical protein